MKVHLDKDYILRDTLPDTIAAYISNIVRKHYVADPSADIEVVASPKFYRWIVKHWPEEYLRPGPVVFSSRLGKVLRRFGLRDPFEKRRQFKVADAAFERMRQDIIENNRLLCFGVYFPLRLARSGCDA